MTKIELFTAALELPHPWYIERIELKPAGAGQELHLHLAHHKGAKFWYEAEGVAGADHGVYDHQRRTWQHLHFFQHVCFIHAGVPRVRTAGGKVRLVDIPWAQRGSGFTLLFEDRVIELIRDGMAKTGAARQMGTTDKRIAGVIKRRVCTALAAQPLAPVREPGVDETSRRRGHNYLTVLTDRGAKRWWACLGKDGEAVAHALLDMEIRGAGRGAVRCVTTDLSPAYIKASKELFPGADLVFDRFHLMQLFARAIDAVRRREQRRGAKDLVNTRYDWLRNADRLSDKRAERLRGLMLAYPDLGTIYQYRQTFKTLLDAAHEDHRVGPLKTWIKLARTSGIAELEKLAASYERHWYGIKTYFKRLATNAFAERVNLTIQQIKRTAKGYRNMQNFIHVIYLHLGGLKLLSTE